MNTQSLLFERSGEIPEGLYIELMNKLKTDFVNNEQQTPKQTLIVILSKNIPKKVVMSKEELIQQIIKESVNWEDRENILCFVTKKRTMYSEIKEVCYTRSLPIMKVNPRWVIQEAILERNPVAREVHRQPGMSPNVLIV